MLQELAQRADCEMSSKSNSGQSAVHMAAMMGHVRVLHFLLNELTPPMVRRHNAFRSAEHSHNSGRLEFVNRLTDPSLLRVL